MKPEEAARLLAEACKEQSNCQTCDFRNTCDRFLEARPEDWLWYLNQ